MLFDEKERAKGPKSAFPQQGSPKSDRLLGRVEILPKSSTEGPQGSRYSARTAWYVSSGILLCGALYISSFWGTAAHSLPTPLDQWSNLYYRLIGPYWNTQLESLLPAHQRYLLYLLVEAYLLGLIIPVLTLLLLRQPLTGVGLGRPNVLGLRFIGVDLLFSLPFGFWLLTVMGNTTVNLGQYLVSLAAMVPEHLLICGIFVALLLPGRHLPCPVRLSVVDGPWWRRILRWLGLAQDAPDNETPLLRWFGLTKSSFFAIVGSGLLFAIAHTGKKHTLEVLLSLPVGVLFAYLTVRSHSILPALVSHWSLNLAPLALRSIL